MMEGYVDKIVQVVTNDGRNIVGILKGFDQTTNVILEDCNERVFSSTAGVEQVALGLYIVRGDNMCAAPGERGPAGAALLVAVRVPMPATSRFVPDRLAVQSWARSTKRQILRLYSMTWSQSRSRLWCIRPLAEAR